jgi:cytochrome c551/c552
VSCAHGANNAWGVSWGKLAICLVAGCATSVDSQPQFSVTREADFSKDASVSVFGIFRNGRLSPGSWADFGAGLSLPFSQKACEAAYTNDLVNANPGLTSVVDDYAKENGVSDELLDRFAPLAKGDMIMVIGMMGQPTRVMTDAGAEKTSKPAKAQSSPGQGNYSGAGTGPGGGRGMGRGGGGGLGRGGFGGRRPAPASSEHPKPERGVWEVSASFFSVSLHHSVGQVTMTYSGQNSEGALKAFADKLGTEMPGVLCRGWDWSAGIDSDSLRKMLEP